MLFWDRMEHEHDLTYLLALYHTTDCLSHVCEGVRLGFPTLIAFIGYLAWLGKGLSPNRGSLKDPGAL